MTAQPTTNSHIINLSSKPRRESSPTGSSAQAIMRQRKKPHMLPPLDMRRSSMDSRAEMVGSPVPRWRRPSMEEQLILQEPPREGKPAIRLTKCPDQKPPETNSANQSPAIHISSRYTPLEPIKRRSSSQS